MRGELEKERRVFSVYKERHKPEKQENERTEEKTRSEKKTNGESEERERSPSVVSLRIRAQHGWNGHRFNGYANGPSVTR